MPWAPATGRDGPARRPDRGSPATTPAWHSLSAAQALEAQGVDPSLGLTDAEAAARLARNGPNKLTAGRVEPKWRAFLRQYRDPMQIVLVVAGGISLFLPGQLATGVLLILLTLFNAALGLNQEGKAEASVAALQKMLIVKARVTRARVTRPQARSPTWEVGRRFRWTSTCCPWCLPRMPRFATAA